MMEWFMSGGFGMFTVLAIGVGAIGYGVKTVRHVSAERLAVLRVLPGLIVTCALFAFGTNLWAVNRALESDTFAKARGITEAHLPVTGLIGFTEAGQVFTLAGLLALLVLTLRVVAEAKGARSSAA
jgi:hypothetical protein